VGLPVVEGATHARPPASNSVGYDRTYKADLVERLDDTPELVILGGSRAQRFEPALASELTGLSAFNFAVQNCRPADAYAISRYLLLRAPDAKLRCVYFLQDSSFVDLPLNPALLYDDRFSASLSSAEIERQKIAAGVPEVRDVLSCNEFGERGDLRYGPYDEREKQGRTLDQSLADYLRTMLPRAAAGPDNDGSQSRRAFRALLALYNRRGVTPLIVLMPYHPHTLSAFRAVGWQRRHDATVAFLERLQREHAFELLDLTELASFGGAAEWFYDGAHVKAENARLILRKAVESAPECFR
jgi:hypothetical protein